MKYLASSGSWRCSVARSPLVIGLVIALTLAASTTLTMQCGTRWYAGEMAALEGPVPVATAADLSSTVPDVQEEPGATISFSLQCNSALRVCMLHLLYVCYGVTVPDSR
jgi:hypothetical protein